jgi:hypothetical protein
MVPRMSPVSEVHAWSRMPSPLQSVIVYHIVSE